MEDIDRALACELLGLAGARNYSSREEMERTWIDARGEQIPSDDDMRAVLEEHASNERSREREKDGDREAAAAIAEKIEAREDTTEDRRDLLYRMYDAMQKAGLM